MNISDFDYHLPQNLIAQKPLERRDESKLLVLNREKNLLRHDIFSNISNYLKRGDMLVVNNTKVMPARLIGKKETGASVEVVLLKRISGDLWEALVKPGKKIKPGNTLIFDEGSMKAEVKDFTEQGVRILKFNYDGDFNSILHKIGRAPLPPYIKNSIEDMNRYQTTYAKEEGSAAAPTAGFHFTQELIDKLKASGIYFTEVLLHIGLDTFRPVKVNNIEEHEMHSEFFEVSNETSKKINMAKERGGKIVCVGTTSVRVLETVADKDGYVKPNKGWSDIYIYPGYKFKAVDALITNFHLPKSTLLIMISAFAGRERILQAYEEAIKKEYRFFSFGDAMYIE